MKNHYLEQFKKTIEAYAQKTDICLANAEAADMKGAKRKRIALEKAKKLAINALENLKKV